MFVIAFGLFFQSVRIRAPWFAVLSEGHHQWLSASSLKFTRNWYREGPWTLQFALLENPRSIEFSGLKSREIYPSYPPGAVVPIYLISLISQQEPTPRLLMTYNLLNHFLIALMLSLIVYVVLLRARVQPLPAFLLSVIPSAFYLFLRGPFYWHQNVFFADQAVILPFVVLVFLEVLRPGTRDPGLRGLLVCFQGIVLFYGTLTDWLFLLAILVVFALRVLSEPRPVNIRKMVLSSFLFWLPVAMALLLFFLQLWSLGVLGQLVEKFMSRSGFIDPDGILAEGFFQLFWKGHLASALVGVHRLVPVVLLWVSLAVFCWYLMARITGRATREAQLVGNTVGMLLVPCFLQVYLLRNHSVVHDFSALKFAVPFAVIPFVLLPVLVLCLLRVELSEVFLRESRWRVGPASVLLGLLALTTLYVVDSHGRFRPMFPTPNRDYAVVGRFINNNTGFNDVVFSPDFEIPANPPQWVSHTMKRVYKVDSVSDIRSKVAHITEPFEVNLLLKGPSPNSMPEGLRQIAGAAYECRRDTHLTLYKVTKAAFLSLVHPEAELAK